MHILGFCLNGSFFKSHSRLCQSPNENLFSELLRQYILQGRCSSCYPTNGVKALMVDRIPDWWQHTEIMLVGQEHCHCYMSCIANSFKKASLFVTKQLQCKASYHHAIIMNPEHWQPTCFGQQPDQSLSCSTVELITQS